MSIVQRYTVSDMGSLVYCANGCDICHGPCNIAHSHYNATAFTHKYGTHHEASTVRSTWTLQVADGVCAFRMRVHNVYVCVCVGRRGEGVYVHVCFYMEAVIVLQYARRVVIILS